MDGQTHFVFTCVLSIVSLLVVLALAYITGLGLVLGTLMVVAPLWMVFRLMDARDELRG